MRTEDAHNIGEEAWSDVLSAVDRTYAELVDYQEQLEARNTELMQLRAFLSSIMTSISDYLVVTGKDLRISDASASFCQAVGCAKDDLVGSAASILEEVQAALFADAKARLDGAIPARPEMLWLSRRNEIAG